MIGQWLGNSIGDWFGRLETIPTEPVEPGTGGGIRHRLMRRINRRIEREIQTPSGPLIVVVPDDWTADDLLQLTTALVLTDALH